MGYKPGGGIPHANYQDSQMTCEHVHHKPAHNNPLLGKTQHRDSEIFPAQLCPISTKPTAIIH